VEEGPDREIHKVWYKAMSWYARGKSSEVRYYYRSRKINGHSFKEYVGRGPVAELIAQLDEKRRQDRQAGRQALLQEQIRLAVADLALQEARGLINLLVWTVLLLGNCHCHHGCWRRRRYAEGCS
jgi:hypothetical protein